MSESSLQSEDDFTVFSNETTTSVPVPVAVLARDLLPYKVAMALHLYYMPLIMSIGLVGNTISFLVMLQKHNQRVSFCIYVAFLSITDNCLLIDGFYYWVMSSGLVRNFNLWECKISATFWSTFSITGEYLVIAMTVDRFLALKYPIKSRSWREPKAAIKICIAVLVGSTAYTAPYLHMANMVGGATCTAIGQLDTFTEVYSVLNIFVGSVCPFTVLLVLNAIIASFILKRLKMKEKKAQALVKVQNADANATDGNESKSSNAIKSSEKQMIFMLFLVTIGLLVLTSPQYIRYVVASVHDYTKTPEEFASLYLLIHLSNKMFVTNFSVNFFMYVLSGTRFRQDVIRLFAGKRVAAGEDASTIQTAA